MKKNKMLRIASVLLVAVLLTTCAISSTLAKYVTSASSYDEARVAYWGFNGTTFAIENLFENVYSNNGTDTVKSNGSGTVTNVIAPGTGGSSTFSFKPQNETAPEVAYKITVTTDGSNCADDIVANTNIQWKLDDGQWGTFAELRTAIAGLSTGTISANTFDGNWEYASTHTVHWQWLINENSAADNAQNVKAHGQPLTLLFKIK